MMPMHIPEALDKYVVINYYVDANHAVKMANRRLRSGIIIYVNNAPIIWSSKHHNMAESSSSGSYFFTLRTLTEIIEDLQYKLICSGVTLYGSTEVFCDNKSVFNNSIISTSVLNKRNNTIFYHRVRDAKYVPVLHVG